jgi:hypothetical protein
MPANIDPKTWMSKIDEHARVSDLVMPGSHDAGVYKSPEVELELGFEKSWAICQHGGLYEQACAGSRFFDCRVFYQAQAEEVTAAEMNRKVARAYGKNILLPGDSEDDFKEQYLMKRAEKIERGNRQDQDDYTGESPGILTKRLSHKGNTRGSSDVGRG